MREPYFDGNEARRVNVTQPTPKFSNQSIQGTVESRVVEAEEVAIKLDALSNRVLELVRQLDDRLSPYMQSSYPIQCEGEEKHRSTIYFNRLDAYMNPLQTAIQLLKDIDARLEI